MQDFKEFFERLQTIGLEYFEKWYGIYQAKVVDNVDPQGQGRIKVAVPSLGRDDAIENFAYPIAPFAGTDVGFFFPPEIGDLVWVMFERGDPKFPLYIGGWWTSPNRIASQSNVPSELKTAASPKKRGIKTKGGHTLIFDDTANTITLKTKNGKKIEINDTTGIISFGSGTPNKSFVKGEDLKTVLDDIITKFNLHTHVVAGTTATQTANQITGSGASSAITNSILSTTVKGE